MRLVCPNCEAKYEVPEDAIPETGRDVQCANCGHAWYQMRPRAASAETAPAAQPPSPVVPVPEPQPPAAAVAVAPPAPEPAAVLEPELDPAPAVAPVAEPEAQAVTAEPAPLSEVVAAMSDTVAEGVAGASAVAAAAEAAAGVAAVSVAKTVAQVQDQVTETVDAALDSVAAEAKAVMTPTNAEAEPVEPAPAPDVAAPAAAAVAPAAYAVDDSVLAILREEAEREANARKAEAAKPLEVQTDLGIDAALALPRKPVEVENLSAAPAVEAADDRSTVRRSQLPDVEEIKSSLQPGEEPLEAAGAEMTTGPVDGRSSFRKGFTLVMVFAILGAALYVSADTLAAAVPALAGVLDAYIGFIDSLRLQLDGLMQSATVAINGSGT